MFLFAFLKNLMISTSLNSSINIFSKYVWIAADLNIRLYYISISEIDDVDIIVIKNV